MVDGMPVSGPQPQPLPYAEQAPGFRPGVSEAVVASSRLAGALGGLIGKGPNTYTDGPTALLHGLAETLDPAAVPDELRADVQRWLANASERWGVTGVAMPGPEAAGGAHV